MSNCNAYTVRTVLCFVVATVGVLPAGCRSNENDRPEREEASAADQYKGVVAMIETRQYKQLIGKTVQDVTSLLGIPDQTHLDSDESGGMVYYVDKNQRLRLDAGYLEFTIENGKIADAYVQRLPRIPRDPHP